MLQGETQKYQAKARKELRSLCKLNQIDPTGMESSGLRRSDTG